MQRSFPVSRLVCLRGARRSATRSSRHACTSVSRAARGAGATPRSCAEFIVVSPAGSDMIRGAVDSSIGATSSDCSTAGVPERQSMRAR